MASTRDSESVERLIAAEPEAIFALLADPRRHPEIDGSGTVKGALIGPARLTLGAEFGMAMQIGAMQIGLRYSMMSNVVELQENRRIAWQPRPMSRLARHFIGGRIWRYELELVPGGTLVRETWDISQEKLPILIRPQRQATRRAMERTLERIEDIVVG